MPSAEHKEIRGHVDGYRDGRIYGWAWQPSAPDDTLLIEVLVDGVVVAETAAWMPRADLSEAGIGDGRHGFDVAVTLDVERLHDVRVVVRVKDGEPLPGALVQGEAGGAATPLDAEIAAFVDSVLTSGGQNHDRKLFQARQGHPIPPGTPSPVARWQLRDSAVVSFIVYRPLFDRPVAAKSEKRGETRANKLLARLLKKPLPAERDVVDVPTPNDSRIRYLERVYANAAPAINSLLGRLGSVYVARDPVDDVNRIYESCLARGESSLFLYYALPHQMVLGSRCPTMPILAWDCPNIPTEVWAGDPRHDWRHVLLQTAGAITLSGFAATAVRQAMGGEFPVLTMPVPIWDRSATAGRKAPVQSRACLEYQWVAFDSRTHVFKLGDPMPQPPRREAGSAQIALDGVVFTAIAAPRDGTEDWPQILSAFIVEFEKEADATLVFKMVGQSLSEWWWQLSDLLARFPLFRCRVLVVQDFTDDTRHLELIATTHWIVNASISEAVCLPLLEFMSAGRPAVAPAHTAMADFVDTTNAVVVRSEGTYWWWPHDPEQRFTTLTQSIDWISFREGLREAYRITKTDSALYAAMSDAAMATMRRFCADDVVLRAVSEFLELRADPAANRSKLVPA